MIKSIVILSCILAISQLGNISHALNQSDWSTGNDKVLIPNEKTVFDDLERDDTNRTKRNVVLLIPVSTSEEADNSQEAESEEVDEIHHGHKTKRCKAPNPLRKARRISVIKNPQKYFSVSTESSVDKSGENLDEGRSYFRLASMKDAKNILKSILKSRSTKREGNDAIVETVSNPQDQASISLLTKSAKRSGQRGKKYVCYCIEDNCGSKKTKNPSRPYTMKRPTGPNALVRNIQSANEENQRLSEFPLTDRQTVGAPNNLRCPPGAVLVEESDYSERSGRKHNPKRRPVKKCPPIVTPCDSDVPSIGQPTRINIPLSSNRKLNRRVYKVDRKLPFAQKLQSVIEQNEAHGEAPCLDAETSNNDGINLQDYYNDQQSKFNQYAQVPLAPNLVYPSPYVVYPQYPQFPQYPQYDDSLVGEPQIPLQHIDPPCDEYQELPYEATPLGRNFIDINECIKMFGRNFCIVTTTTITSLPENGVNYGNEDEEPAIGSHWDEEIDQSNTESPHGKTTWGYPTNLYNTDNVAVTHLQEPESSDNVDENDEDHLHNSGSYPVSTTRFPPDTVQSYGVVGSNQEKSPDFDEHENFINQNSPLRYNDPNKFEYLMPIESDDSVESEIQDMYELGDETKEGEVPNTLSSEKTTEFPQLGKTISSNWQGAHRISSPQYLEYTVKPTEKYIPPSSSEDISEDITGRIPTTHDSNLSQYETSQYRYLTQSFYQQQGKNGNTAVDYYTRKPNERVGNTKPTIDGSLDNDDEEKEQSSSESPNTVFAIMEEPWVNYRTTVLEEPSRENELQSSQDITTIYPIIDNEDRPVSTSSKAQSVANRVDEYSVSPSSNLYYSMQPEISTADYASSNAKITGSSRQHGIVESTPVQNYPKSGYVSSATSGSNNGYASSDAAIKNTGFYTTPYYAEEKKITLLWPQEVKETNTKYDFKESPLTPKGNFYPHFVGSHQSINNEKTTEKSDQQFFESHAPITENYISTLTSSESVGNSAGASKNKYTTSYIQNSGLENRENYSEEYSFDTKQPEDVTNNYDGVTSRDWYYSTQSGRKTTSSIDRPATSDQSSQGQYVKAYHSIPSGITSTPVRSDLTEKPAFYSGKIDSSTTIKGLEDDGQRSMKTSSRNNFYSTPSARPSFTVDYRTSLESEDLKSVHSNENDYSNEDITNTTSQSILGGTMTTEDEGKSEVQHEDISRYSSQKSHPLISTPSEYEYYNEGKSPLSDSEKMYSPIITTDLLGDHQKTTEMASKYNFYSTQSEEPFATNFHRASTEPTISELVHSTRNDDYSNEDTTNSYMTSQSILGETMAVENKPSQKSHPFISTPSEYEQYNKGKIPLSDSGQMYSPIITKGLLGDHQKTTEMASKYNFYSTQSEEPFATDFHRVSTEPANVELVHSTGDDHYSNKDTTNSYTTSQSILGETMAVETKPRQKSHPFISTPSKYEHYNEEKTPLSDSGKMYSPIITTGLLGDHQKTTEMASKYNFYSTQSEEPFATDSQSAGTEPTNSEFVHSTGDDDYSNEDTTNSYMTSQSILGETVAVETKPSQKSHRFMSTPSEYKHYNEEKSPLSDSGKMYSPIITTGLLGDHQKTTEMASKYNFYSTQSEEPFATDSHRASTEPANVELVHSTGDYDYSNEDTTNSYMTSQSILGETMAVEKKPSQKSHPLISTPSEYKHYNEEKSPLSDSGKMYSPIITTGLLGDHQKTTEMASKYNFYSTQSEEPFATDSHRASTEPTNVELVHSTGDDDYSNEDTTNSYMTSQSILGETVAVETKPSQKSHRFMSTPSEYEHYNEGKTPLSDSAKKYSPIITTGLLGDHQKTTEMASKYNFYSTQSEEPFVTDSQSAGTEPTNSELVHSTGNGDYSNEDTTNSYVTSQSILGETMAVEKKPSQKSHPLISTPSEYKHYNEEKSPLSDSGKMYSPIITTGLLGDHQKTTEMASKYNFYSTQSEEPFATDSHRASTEPANVELVHSTGDYDYSNEDTTNSYMTSQSILGETMAVEKKPSQKSHPLISTPSEYKHYNEEKSPLSDSGKMYSPIITTGLLGDHQKTTEMASKYNFYSTQSEEPFVTDSQSAGTEPTNSELVHSTGNGDYSNEDTTNSYMTSQSILGETMAVENKPSQKSHPFISTPSEHEHYNEGKSPLSDSGKMYSPIITTGLLGDHQKTTEMASKYNFNSTQSEEPFATDSHRASTEPANVELVHSTGDYDYSNEDTTNSYMTSQSILGETMAVEKKPSQKYHPLISTPSEYKHYNEEKSPLSDSGKMYSPIITTGLLGDHQKTTEMASKYNFYSTQSEEPFATDSHRASTEPANVELVHSTGDYDYSNEDTTNSYMTSQSILGETMAVEKKPSQKSHPLISTPSEYKHYNEEKSPLSDSGKMYSPIITTGLLGDHQKTTEMASKYNFYSTQFEDPLATDSHSASTEPTNSELVHSNEDTTNSYMTSQSILGETMAVETKSSQKSHPFITTPSEYNYYEGPTSLLGHSLQPSEVKSNSYDGKVGKVIGPNSNNEESSVKTVNDFTTMSSDDLRLTDKNDGINYSTQPKTVDGSSFDYLEDYTTTHDFIGKELSQTKITGNDNDYDYSTIKPMTQVIEERKRPTPAENYEKTDLTTTIKVADEEVIGQSQEASKLSTPTSTRYLEDSSTFSNILKSENIVRDESSTINYGNEPTLDKNDDDNYFSSKNHEEHTELSPKDITSISEVPSEKEIGNPLDASNSNTQSSVTRHFENPSIPQILRSENMVRDQITTEVEKNYDSTTNEYPQSNSKTSIQNPIEDEYKSSENDDSNSFSSIHQEKSTSPQSVISKNVSPMVTLESSSSTLTNEKPQLTTHEFVGDTLTDKSSSAIKDNDGAFISNAVSSTQNKYSTVSLARTEPTFSTVNKNNNLEDAKLLNNDKIPPSSNVPTETSISEVFTPSYDVLRKALKAMTATNVNTEATSRLTTEKITQQDDISSTSSKQFTPIFDKVGDNQDTVTTSKENDGKTISPIINNNKLPSDEYSYTSDQLPHEKSQAIEYSTHPYKSISSAMVVGNTRSQSFPDSQDVTSSTVEYGESKNPEHDSTPKDKEFAGTALKTHSIITTLPPDTLRPISTDESINNSYEKYSPSSSPNGIVLQPHYDDYQMIATIGSLTNDASTEYSPYAQTSSATVVGNIHGDKSSPKYKESTSSDHDLMLKNEKLVESTQQTHSITTTDPADVLRSMLTDEPASNSHEKNLGPSSTNRILLQPYYTDYQTISTIGSSTQSPQTDYSPYKSISTSTVLGNTLASQSLPNSEDVTSSNIELSKSTPESGENQSAISTPESASYRYDTYGASSSTTSGPTQTPRTESSLYKSSSSATLVGNTLGSQSFTDSDDVTSSSTKYEDSTTSEHDLTPMNQGSVGGALHTYSATTTQSTEKFTTNSAKESLGNNVSSSTIGIELQPKPPKQLHQNNHISDKDRNILRTAVQKVVNDLISPSNDAYKNGAKTVENVGTPNEGLLPKLPVLKNLFSLPEVKDMAISTVKGLITAASGVPQDSSLGRLEDHVIESVLNSVVNDLIPEQTTPSSSMNVDEHRYENGRWTEVPATLVPTKENVGLQPDAKISNSIQDILGRPGISLQGAKLPVVQNIIVRAVENVLKKAKNVVDHSVIWDTLNNIIARAEEVEKSHRVPVLTTKSLPKLPDIKTPNAPMKILPIIPITERVFKNGQWSDKHTVLGKTRKNFEPKLSTSSITTTKNNNEFHTLPFNYKSSMIEINKPDYTTKPVDYALLGESEENLDETTLQPTIGMIDLPNETTIEAVGAASRNQNIDDKEDLEKSPIEYYSPHDRILTYIKNHQTPSGKMPTTLSSLDTQQTTGYYRPSTVMESNETVMDDESDELQHSTSNNYEVPTGLTKEPKLGATEKKKTCKCIDEEEKHIDNKVGSSRQNFSQELTTITPITGEENDFYSQSTIHHLDVEDDEDTDYTTEEFIGENNSQMIENSRKDSEKKILSTEPLKFSSTIHHLDVIDNGYSTDDYISKENVSTEETTVGMSENVENTQLSSPQSTVNYSYEDEENEEETTQEYTDVENASMTDTSKIQFTEKQLPSTQNTDSTIYFDISSQTAKVGNARNFDQGSSTTDVLKTTTPEEDRIGITHGDESMIQTLDKKIPKLTKYTDESLEATTMSRGLIGAAKKPKENELLQENLKDSPSFVTPKWDPTYFGKISPSNRANLDGDKISDLANTELFYVGDGVKIPLTIRRMPDGSYALSISEKICENFVNRECPCCVPKEGDIVEEKRQLNDPEDAEYETVSSKNFYDTRSFDPTESSEYENKSKKRYVRSTSGSDVIVTSASPVSSFIQKYNLTLNLKNDPVVSSLIDRKTTDEIINKNKSKFSRSSDDAKILNLFKNNNMIQRDNSEEERPIMDDNSEIISKESNTLRRSEFTYDSDTNSFIRSLVNIRDVPENKRAEVILNALDGLINSATAKNLDSTKAHNTIEIIDDDSTNDQDSSDFDLDEVENEMARYGYQKDNPILERIRYIKKYQQGHGRYKYQQNIDHHVRGKMNVLKTVLHWLKEVFLESKVNSKK